MVNHREWIGKQIKKIVEYYHKYGMYKIGISEQKKISEFEERLKQIIDYINWESILGEPGNKLLQQHFSTWNIKIGFESIFSEYNDEILNLIKKRKNIKQKANELLVTGNSKFIELIKNIKEIS